MITSLYFENEELKLKSSAATPILFRQMFKVDLLKSIIQMKSIDKDSVMEDGEGLEFLDFIKELAFIMNIEATVPSTEVFQKLNMENYLAFLLSFDEQMFTSNSAQIIKVWTGSSAGMSEQKNVVNPQ